jgi:hypothetical protein
MSTRSEVKKVIPDGTRLRSLDEKIVVHITGAPHLITDCPHTTLR